MAARPTPSKQGNTRKRLRSDDSSDDRSSSVRTATHKPLFDERKKAVLSDMYYKRKEIFKQEVGNRLSYVNETIGQTNKVVLKGDAALVLVEDYRHSPDCADDAKAYIRKVMNRETAVFQDIDFTYEQLLLAKCPDKSTLIPWNNLVPRLVSFNLAGMKNGPVDKWRSVISLFGSSGCGKSKALKAVAEEIMQQLPNHVVYLPLDWKSDIAGTSRNIKVSEKLLKEVNEHVGRKIQAEVDCGLPLPDPKKFALVVTLDEIGRVPESARGLVSISRQLNGDVSTTVPPAVLTLRKVFDLVVIVLAGTSGETIATSKSEQGGIVVTDPSMVYFCNMDTPHCKVNGEFLTAEAYRKELVRHHIKLITHNPWLGGSLLKSRLRLALDNPRVVSIVAEITRLLYTKTPDKADIPAAFPNEHEPTNPLSRHEFDHWAPLLANRYCALNGLSNLSPFSPDPRAYSQQQRVFLLAHYVWDHHASDEIKTLVNEVLTFSSRSGKANCLLKLQRLGLLTFLDLVDAKEQQQYNVSIPPSLPYIALAALDCTVGFGGGGWSAWECVAMQSVGLRYAAAMAWKGCATVGDAVPGLYVPLESVDPTTPAVPDPLTWPVASVENSNVRHWCAVVAPVQLCGYARNKFNVGKEKEKIKKRKTATTELGSALGKAKNEFIATQAEKELENNKKVGTYWKEKVLPLLEEHTIVLVQNAEKAPAADCFALIRVNRTSAGKPIRADEKSDGKPILLVAQLQMKDFSYSTAPHVDEEMAKMGVYIDGITTARRQKVVKAIHKRSKKHQAIMQAAFSDYELYFGAVICMSRAEPRLSSTDPWKSLVTLQVLVGNGVMYATPVLQRVFHPFDAPAGALEVKEKKEALAEKKEEEALAEEE